ncbi:hypothetical protein LQZ18_01180 [Lachnospiraceae bacterium ZAX-1]
MMDLLETVHEMRNHLQYDLNEYYKNRNHSIPKAEYVGCLHLLNKILKVYHTNIDESLSAFENKICNAKDEYIFRMVEVLDEIELAGIELNNDPIIIKRTSNNTGLGAFMTTNLMCIVTAVDLGQLPIIDMRGCWELDSVSANTNVWELFFEQPFSKGLCGQETAKQELNQVPRTSLRAGMDLLTNEYLLGFWRKKYNQFIRFNKETQKHIDEVYGQIADQKLLGVICRGTDLEKLRPYNHFVQPPVDKMIEKAQMIMKEKNCRKLYLATEDARIYQKFRDVFGSDLIFTQEHLIHNHKPDQYLYDVYKENNSDMVKINLDYVTALAILSKCSCFLGGIASGTLLVHLMTSGFEYSYLYNLGQYRLDDPVGLISKGYEKKPRFDD